jgi:putative two-component system response regulator
MSMAAEIKYGKILIVDDEKEIRRAVRHGLTKAGYQCFEAADHIEAVNQVAILRPDLVILDEIMPGRLGHELIAEILTSYPGTAVIMATAVIDPRIIIGCMKSGARDYITKPYNLEEVIASVSKTLDLRRLELNIAEYQKEMEHTIDNQRKEIRNIFLGSIESLVNAMEAKDKYTAGHARRVTRFAITIGEKMGLPAGDMEDLRWGSLLHDIGKIAMDSSIQNKPDSLTEEEYRYMMSHAVVGACIVKPLANQKTIDIIMHHHDHFDRSAIDQTIAQEEIPLGARIVAVADSFDAMTSDRPYRGALPTKKALAEIRRCSGTQFDPSVVEVFLTLPISEMMNSIAESSQYNRSSLFLPV